MIRRHANGVACSRHSPARSRQRDNLWLSVLVPADPRCRSKRRFGDTDSELAPNFYPAARACSSTAVASCNRPAKLWKMCLADLAQPERIDLNGISCDDGTRMACQSTAAIPMLVRSRLVTSTAHSNRRPDAHSTLILLHLHCLRRHRHKTKNHFLLVCGQYLGRLPDSADKG